MDDKRTESWYCLKAKTKKEHIAANMLRCRGKFEVFCPRVTITKNTIRGPKPFTEALFPGYLFCRFNFQDSARLISYSQNITGIVRFGERVPVIPDETLTQLMEALPNETVEVPPSIIQEGELVEIIQGCLLGESGKVTKMDTKTNRAHLLMEFLGALVKIELSAAHLINFNPASPGISLGLQASSKP